MDTEEVKKTCCFCGKEIDGRAESPWPYEFSEKYGAVCCEQCYKKEVLPAIYQMNELFKKY